MQQFCCGACCQFNQLCHGSQFRIQTADGLDLDPELFQRLLHHIYSSRGQQGIKIEGLIKILTILIKIRQAPHIHLILAGSHSIRMLRSPRYAKMGHWPNIYIATPNIYMDADIPL